ncbi:MAG: NADH-quinone oxidoreductase subunit NuoF [Candidatus Merdousia sp.]|nr:NADH-quinone oxidoreductase subunit NuoF [Candidatus Merdousia sp.]
MEILKSQRESAKKRWSEFFESDKPRILVGAATCGRAAGALDVMEEFKKELSAAGISDKVELVETGCLGLCYAEPLVEIRACGTPSVLYSNVSPKDVAKLVKEHVVGGNAVREKAEAVMSDTEYDGIVPFKKHPMVELQKRVVLRNCGVINPDDFWHYLARGGYEGLERAFSMSPEDVIEEMKKSGLRGRGGAGFPTGMKWSFARASKSDEKYIICNADEGDPGAFMDRSVLEGDPHAVVEGLMIAGYAIGAQHAYIYVRSEYPLAIERLKTAIKQAEEAGLLRKKLENGFEFEIKIKKGSGAFVCGEETSLMASIEGVRAMPRPKPPFPANSGLFKKPTNINNVETLAATSSIMRMGADKYAAFGSEKSRGTKTFSLAGKIKRTGLIEVELGIKLGDIVNKIGGGCTDGKNFKAVQTGGPSGGCLTKEHFDLPVDYENLAAVGSIIGSGGMVVMNEDSCMVEVAKYFVNFTENESCGKCVPCRMGTQHLHRILEKITSGHGEEGDIERLKKIAQTMKESSLCGLGQTAPNPILTTLRYFGDEYKAHIEEKKCPALACSKLVVYAVERDKCKGCTLCERACPTGAISGGLKKPHSIDASKCISCGACFQTCKFGAITRR